MRIQLPFSGRCWRHVWGTVPSHPKQNGTKWVKMSAFFGHNIARGRVRGDDGMNPKPNKKLSSGAGSYVTIAWRGCFTRSQVLLSSLVALTGKGQIFEESFIGGLLKCEPACRNLFDESEPFFASHEIFPPKTSKYGHNAFLWCWLHVVYMCSAKEKHSRVVGRINEKMVSFLFISTIVFCF